MKRIEGWELRLSVVLEYSRVRPYVLGGNDCLRLALKAVEALTGREMWSRFEGRYATKFEALRLMMNRVEWPRLLGREIPDAEADAAIEKVGPFNAVFCALFETTIQSVALARRGDICKYVDIEEHLGVCTGSHIALLKQSGLVFAPLHNGALCWRIG